MSTETEAKPQRNREEDWDSLYKRIDDLSKRVEELQWEATK